MAQITVAAAPRPGRPYRPPEDRVAREAVRVDRTIRTAWLLGTTRMFAHDGRYRQRRDFLEALHGAGVACDASRVSRWESGAATPPTSVVAAYESVLGVRPYLLRGALDLLRPPGAPIHGLPTLPEMAHERLDALLDTALGGSATGLEWLELVQTVTRTEHLYLREKEWRSLAQALVSEYSRSVSTGYLCRHSALGELIAHPVAQPHVVRAVGEVVLDGRLARGKHTIRLLSSIPSANTSALVLRLLDSTEPSVRSNAAYALADLLADGAFDEQLMSKVVGALVRALQSDSGPAYADALLRLPEEPREHVRRAVHPSLLGQASHELVSSDTARALSRRVAKAANEPWRQTLVECESMLVLVIREALFHAHHRRRSAALGLLAVSPYAAGFATGCLELLDHHDTTVVRQALRCIGWTGNPGDLARLAALTTEPNPAAVRRDALGAIATLPGDLDPVGADAVIAAHGAPDGVGDAAAWTLGMRGRTDLIGPPAPRADGQAGWWEHATGRLAV